MDGEKKEYKLIIKSFSLLGSAQVLGLIITLIRSKAIALFLGPKGIAIAGLFNTTLELFSTVTSLGIDKSGVKEISFISATKNEDAKIEIITLIERLGWYTGVVGSVLMIVFSKVLSELVFNSADYTYAFVWLSLALLFKQLSYINFAVLQGVRVISSLARANVYGSAIGLIISVPLYYFLELKAIVPVIIISNIIVFFVSRVYLNKVSQRGRLLPFKFMWDLHAGKEIIRLGVLLNFTSIVSIITTYTFQVYLTNITTLEIVGFYLVGVAILNYCVNIVFNAMSMDYYPRLAAIHKDNTALRKVVEQQALISMLVITPIIVFFIALAPFVIKVLYSSKFLDVIVFVKWSILGMLFKAVSWCISYVFIAKGDSKVFLRTNVIFNMILLTSNILGFKILGLNGVGIAFFVYHIIYFISVFIIASFRYEFYFEKEFYTFLFISFGLCISVFIFSNLLNTILKYVLMGVTVLISIVFTVYQINKKINIKETFQKFRK